MIPMYLALPRRTQRQDHKRIQRHPQYPINTRPRPIFNVLALQRRHNGIVHTAAELE